MAQPKFSVGEMVITQHATYFSELDGSLGIITQPLQRRLCNDLNLMEKVYGHVYQVKLLVEGEPRLSLRPWQLRKLGSSDAFETKNKAKVSRRKQKANLVTAQSESLK